MEDFDLLERENLTVLDQGFGLGSMLFTFKRSCEIAGLELSPAAVEAAIQEARHRGFKKVDLRVFEPNRPFASEWKSRFDVVISSHVLEHTGNPEPVLDDLVYALKPDGVLCILVPINEQPGEDLNHFHQFTSEALRRLVSQRGLEILYVKDCDRLYQILKPVAMARQRKDSLPLKTLSKLLNAVLAPLPNWALQVGDKILSVLGVQPCQCLMLARNSRSKSAF